MKFNKFNLIIAILFMVGFVLIFLNFLTDWLNLVALALFVVASVMLTIALFNFCKKRNAILTAQQEEIIMELALEDGMEKYIPVEKKKGKFKTFRDNIKIFSPCILSGMLTILMIALLVLSLV